MRRGRLTIELSLLHILFAVSHAHSSEFGPIIKAAHARSRELRLKLLSDWTLSDDNGWVRPTPGSYEATFSAAPIQHVVVAMFKNDNLTAVRLAQRALSQANESSHFGSVYEWTVVARAFALFSSSSNCSRCARMPRDVESRMANMTFQFASKNNHPGAFCGGVLPSQGGGVMCQSGSENLDFDAKGHLACKPERMPPKPEPESEPDESAPLQEADTSCSAPSRRIQHGLNSPWGAHPRHHLLQAPHPRFASASIAARPAVGSSAAQRPRRRSSSAAVWLGQGLCALRGRRRYRRHLR